MVRKYNRALDIEQIIDEEDNIMHITTTSKISHLWEFNHDEIGFNYRLPNLNAALGLAQIERLPSFIENKRWIAKQYHEWGRVNDVQFFEEPKETESNYWLNILL